MIRSVLPMLAASSTLVLSACGTLSMVPQAVDAKSAVAVRQPRLPGRGEDVALFALGLLQTSYRFGGKNPEAGFDCSGMVSYVFDKAARMRLTGSAAELAKKGRPTDDLRPGDLVFFNTLNRPRSHVGIYIGDGRFVHAPSTRGEARVRTDSLASGWYASRFEEARTYFD